MNLEFRMATPEDADACIRLRGMTRENAISAAQLRAMGVTAETWAAQVREGALSGHVCSLNGHMVGYCFGTHDNGEIVVLAVLPEHEGHGIGKLLLTRMAGDLFKRGKARLHLACSSDPASRSHGFYRHLGWRSTGQWLANGDEVLAYGRDCQTSKS